MTHQMTDLMLRKDCHTCTSRASLSITVTVAASCTLLLAWQEALPQNSMLSSSLNETAIVLAAGLTLFDLPGEVGDSFQRLCSLFFSIITCDTAESL